MLRNYFKIAFRNLLRNKGFSIINISGLAIGMAGAMLILMWIQHEFSYDQFHENKDRIYEMWNRTVFDGKLQSWGTTPKVLGKTLKQEYPDIQEVSRVEIRSPFLLIVGDNKVRVKGGFVDPGFLSMFSFPVLKGDAKTALNNVYSIVITEKLAKSLFNDDNPIGKTIKIENKDNFIVTGLVKNPPSNSHFQFEYLLPWAYLTKIGWDDDYWGNNSTDTYIELKKGVNAATFNAKVRDFTIRHSKGEEQNELFIHPLSKLRLYSKFDGKLEGGRIDLVKIFGILAAFILVIACINFMNLSTARSEKRAKEVGIRKVIGAERTALVRQFLGESILLALIAGVLAIAIVQLFLPVFNSVTEKQLSVQYGNPYFWLFFFSFILFTGMLAGSYPAFYLSAFQPVRVLKGTLKAVHTSFNPRKVLVITQFTIAIILIISTLFIRRQIQYSQERETGYSKDNLIYHFLTEDLEKNYPVIKEELLSSGTAISVCKTSAPITQGFSNSWGFEWKGKDPKQKIIFNRFCVDDDLTKTIGLKIIQGRDINLKEFPTDSTACILSESAARIMGFKDPVGQIVKDNGIDWHVVGVIKDFVLQSPFENTEPMVIEGAKGWFNVIHIKLNPANSTAQNIKAAEQIFKKHNFQFPFEYQFIDQEYAQKFNDAQRTSKLITIFAMLTIIISCMGLFGLATYMAENRTKEIGVRKVLGASVINITALLSKDFLKLIVIAILIASPIAYWAMSKWLQTFSYHINMQWWIFIASGIVSLFIAFSTVSYQAIKAAMANPVKSLRTE
ncbi:ABC transporter permease [Solitalea sp. MAHUQ-68]|uniref:ABC transporter permease n=1 Tax=Solitalea agri TaxID=2953739 RepID=A0A9X2EZD6_9SPHI|nr:ABC transporter permease [Solitalea agri]MCO4291839.1 ABC transporter permease [Solitalea agri]